jgi:hypothetical protein
MNGITNLTRKVEDALYSYISAEAVTPPDTGVYRAIEAAYAGATMQGRRIEITCPSSSPMDDAIDASAGVSNRRVRCEIAVRTPPANVENGPNGFRASRDSHDEIVGGIMDALHVAGLPAALSSQGVEGLAVDQVDLPEENTSIEDAHIVTRISFDLLAYSV